MLLDEIYSISDDTAFRRALRAYVEERLERLGYDHVTEGERRLTRIQGFCWEVNGNGFEGFFENSLGDDAEEIRRDLLLVGARENAAQLKGAMELFPEGIVPKDRAERRQRLTEILKDDASARRFSQLLLNEPREDLPALIAAYVRRNRDHFETSEQ